MLHYRDAMARLRSVFHWKHASWVIGIAAGGTLTAALADKFVLAYCCLVITGIFVIGCWFASDTFGRNFSSQTTLFGPSGGHSFVGRRYAWRWLGLPLVLWLVAFGLAGTWIRDLQVEFELKSFKGILLPADDDTPRNPCSDHPVSAKSVILLLGNNAVRITDFPHAIIT